MGAFEYRQAQEIRDVFQRRNIKYLFINGRQIPLVSRHTMLNDQFKDRK